MRPLAPVALTLLLSALAASAAAAPDTAWEQESRVLDVRGSPTGFTFTSRRDSDLGNDALTGGFDATTARFATTLDVTRPEEASLRLEVTWSALVEYRDADGDGRYGLADPALRTIALRDLPQQTVVAPRLGGGSDATTTYTLPQNGSDPDPILGGPVPAAPGTLRLAFTLVPQQGSVAGMALAPTQVRFAVAVTDFPFQAADTRLAVISELATDAQRLEALPAGVQARQGNHSWEWAWASMAQVDGAQAPTGWSMVASDPQRATAVTSLPRGETVEQGGALSAHKASAALAPLLRLLPPGDWRFYTVGLAGVVLALGIPSVRLLREA